ncbi:HNH endonuclease [Hydrogenophaga sp.]|uniref:HNH endonuclease n=1 Tax=Hydrogenophaga sp. TaxID=1904254 RepID=UPI003D1508AF
MTKSRGINRPRQPWTNEDLGALRRLYPDFSAEVVATVLKRTKHSVHRMAKKLGLAKSAAFLASDLSGRIRRGKQNPLMVANQFKPGIVPWNKGKHVVAGGRSAETRFKPGQMPHTWMPIGSYRVVRNARRPEQLHVEQKVAETPGPNHLRWSPVTRLVWEKAHGPVPEGHIVIFKPGMKTLVPEEITEDRLECITKAENARRNHPRFRDPELGRLVAIKGAITRQVKRIKRNAEELQQ